MRALACLSQDFSSPCCYLSPSSVSGGILLLPQRATFSVGPHRVGVLVRGLSIFADAGPEEDAKVERSDTGPARRNAATQGPKHSCMETIIFRHNHTSVRAPRPVSDHGGPRLDASLFLVPCTASQYQFGARHCFTGQWWYVGPMGTACSCWLLFWDFAAGGAWLGTGGSTVCSDVAAAIGHRVEGRLLPLLCFFSSLQYFWPLASGCSQWHSVRE